MEYQVSARRYRPGSFDAVIGQPHIVQTLKNALESQRVAHAYVFSGMRGVGKTTVARILAKSLNCEHGPTNHPCETCPSCVEIARGQSVDVIEIDGASNTGVDDVRELRENVKFTPFRGGFRVYIIDEVHMLSNSAFNALLKTLEEPPRHAVFIFATTEVHKIPATILSRCQHFTFRRIPRREIIAQLQRIAAETGVRVEERSLSAIARASDGSLRDALSLLDQAVAFGGEQIRHHDLEALIGTVPEEIVRRLIDTVIDRNPSAGVEIIGQSCEQGHDVRILCREVVERIRNLLVAAVMPSRTQLHALLELPDEEVQHIVSQARQVEEPILQEWFDLFSRTEDRLKTSLHPRFVFEAAVVRATLVQEAPIPPKATRPSYAIQGKPSEESSTSQPSPQRTAASKEWGASPQASDHPRRLANSPPPQPAREPAKKRVNLSTGGSGGEASPPARRKSALVSAEPETASIDDADWAMVMERLINEHPNIGSFLEAGTVLVAKPDHIVIGYPKKATTARWRTDKPENRGLIANIFREVTGHQVSVRVVELNEAQSALPSIGQLRLARQQKDDQGLLEEAKAHPLVKQAIDIFGGEVVSARRVHQKKETP